MVYKGAFQVSLTMIIGVVFAVIILGLAISWITGSFSGIQDISEQAIQQAKGNLRQTVDKSMITFAKESVRVDKMLGGAVLIKNTYGNTYLFRIEVIPPTYDNEELFEIEGREDVIPIKPDDIEEHKFRVYTTDTIYELFDDKGREELPVKFKYKIYRCSQPYDLKNDKEKDDDVCKEWVLYDTGNTIIKVSLSA